MSSFDQLMQQTRTENHLFSALIELTYQCNLDCFFCYNDLSLAGQRMQLDDYRKLLDDLAAMNVFAVSLSGGEPLAYPHFFELGAYARELGFVVTIKTNGHMVVPRVAARLRNEIDPYLIETSLHGACAATHDRQTRVPGSFERLLKNIKAMTDEGMRVRLNSTLTAWNEAEIEAMYLIADDLGTVLTFDTDVSPRDDGDAEPLSISASDDGIRSLLRTGMERAKKNAANDALPVKKPVPAALAKTAQKDGQKLKNCAAGSTFVSIDPFGNVYPCVQLRRKVGNLHQTSMMDIWQSSPELSAIREMSFAAHQVRLDNKLSNFCPGLAELRTGSPLKVYPDAERKARLIREVQPAAAK